MHAIVKVDVLGVDQTQIDLVDKSCTLQRRARTLVTHVPPRLRSQLEELFVSPRRNRRFYHVYLDFLTQSVHNPRLGRITAAFYESCRHALAATIAAGCAEGIFRPDLDAEVAASVCGAMMDGLQMQWLFDEEEKFEEYRERCWRGWLALLDADSVSRAA